MARITKTVSGDIVSFKSPGKVPIRSLKVSFSPKQEGTGDPSSSNVRTISGWTGVNIIKCGKNLFDYTNATYDKEINAVNGELLDASNWCVSDYMRVKPNTTYSASNLSSRGAACYALYDKNKNFITRGAENTALNATTIITTDSNTRFVRLSVRYGNDEYLSSIFEEGSATSYEPYNETIISVDWTSDAGIIYGGYIDLISGAVIATNDCFVFDGSPDEPWQLNGADGFYYNKNLYESPSPGVEMCDQYKAVQNSSTGFMHEGECALNAAGYLLQIFDTSESTTTGWRDKLNESPITVIVQKPEPVVVATLSSSQLNSLKGVNNYWSDADSIEVVYDYAEPSSILKVKQLMSHNPDMLPPAYKKIDYIECSGTQWIETNYIPDSNNLIIEWKYMITQQISGDEMMFGTQNGSGGSCYAELYDNQRWYAHGLTYSYRVRQANSGGDSGEHINQIYYAIMDKNSLNIVNTCLFNTPDNTYDKQQSAYIYIFAWRNKNGNQQYLSNGLRLYCLTFKDGNKKQANFVPCIRRQDSKPGMYDTVAHVFYTNAGTGEFIVPQ